MKTIAERANFTFLKQLVKTPAGRVHLLTQITNAEASGELALFERLAALTHELELQRLIRRHGADEVEHSRKLNARIAELGVPRPTLPAALNLPLALDRRLKVLSGPLSTSDDLLRAYVFLQVLEERIVWQFGTFIDALQPVDPVTAALFADILSDEERHLRYCRVITQRMAPHPKVLDQTLAAFRAAESAEFTANGLASFDYVLAHGLLDEPAAVRLGWKTLGHLARLSQQLDPATADARFEHTENAEPHRARRRQLLEQFPSIRHMFGYDRRTIAVTLVVAVVHVTVAAWLSRAANVAVTVVVSYAVGAILSHWLGQTIHETSHRLAARTRWANRALAWFANLPMVLPIAETFHRYHLEHHTKLGTIGGDSDLPLPIEIDLIGTSRVAKFLWLACYPIVYFARGARSARRPSLGEVANVAGMVLANVLLWRALGPVGFAYLALSTFFGHGLHPVAAHFIHEHYLFDREQETSSYYGPLNAVTFNVGYHVEHHDFMNIPGWRLPEYRALVAPAYARQSHRSWACVLTEFIARADLGPASRRVRTATQNLHVTK